jgi:hypothetical protein
MLKEIKLKGVFNCIYDDNTKIAKVIGGEEIFDQCSPDIKNEIWANSQEYIVAYDKHTNRPTSAKEKNNSYIFYKFENIESYNENKNNPNL